MAFPSFVCTNHQGRRETPQLVFPSVFHHAPHISSRIRFFMHRCCSFLQECMHVCKELSKRNLLPSTHGCLLVSVALMTLTYLQPKTCGSLAHSWAKCSHATRWMLAHFNTRPNCQCRPPHKTMKPFLPDVETTYGCNSDTVDKDGTHSSLRPATKQQNRMAYHNRLCSTCEAHGASAYFATIRLRLSRVSLF